MVAARFSAAAALACGLLLPAGALFGCAPRESRPLGAPGASGPDVEAQVEPGQGSSATSAPAAPEASVPGRAAPLPGGEEPTPDKALPELRVEALGMHVGGGTNDPEEKAPFHRALERQFPEFMDCYRLVERAWEGGSFGIDLRIPREGGAPGTSQPRTRMRGAEFRACMVKAFEHTRFERPKAGPTIISYSVRFTLGKEEARASR